jgi:hypothetical protein
MSDTGAKDDFANKVRLITGSYGASAVVLIVESWITKAKADEPLDTLTPPSESYDREEVVVLIGQAPKATSPTSCPSIVSETANSGTWVMLKTCPPIHLKVDLPDFFHPSPSMRKPGRWERCCLRRWA